VQGATLLSLSTAAAPRWTPRSSVPRRGAPPWTPPNERAPQAFGPMVRFPQTQKPQSEARQPTMRRRLDYPREGRLDNPPLSGVWHSTGENAQSPQGQPLLPDRPDRAPPGRAERLPRTAARRPLQSPPRRPTHRHRGGRPTPEAPPHENAQSWKRSAVRLSIPHIRRARPGEGGRPGIRLRRHHLHVHLHPGCHCRCRCQDHHARLGPLHHSRSAEWKPRRCRAPRRRLSRHTLVVAFPRRLRWLRVATSSAPLDARAMQAPQRPHPTLRELGICYTHP